MSADIIVVGTDNYKDNGSRTGAAYVFSATTPFAQLGKLTASDGTGGDTFGNSVAVSGDIIVVGTSYSEYERGSGAAYVFSATTPFAQLGKLTASDGRDLDRFGTSVAISGDIIVVGAWGDDNNSGAAYVFSATTPFAQLEKLSASDATKNSEFGDSVAILGDIIVVGASYNDNDNGIRSGAAYAFDC